jgi:hypothetical protein
MYYKITDTSKIFKNQKNIIIYFFIKKNVLPLHSEILKNKNSIKCW